MTARYGVPYREEHERKGIMGWLGNPRWPVLSGLPTVQFRAVFLCVMDLITIVWLFHTTENIIHVANASVRADPLVLEIILGWLAFLAGTHGFTLAAYNTKRKTSFDGNLEEDRGTKQDDTARPPINPQTGEMATPGRMDRQLAPQTAPNARPDLGVPDRGIL